MQFEHREPLPCMSCRDTSLLWWQSTLRGFEKLPWALCDSDSPWDQCWWPLNLIPSKSIAGGGLMQEHWERNLPLGWLEMQWFISTLISVSEVSVCLWLSNNTWTCWLSCSLMCYWSLWLLGSSFFPCKTCSKLAAWNRSAHFVAKWFIWSFWGGKTLHFQELWASLSLWKPNRMGKSSYSVNV